MIAFAFGRLRVTASGRFSAFFGPFNPLLLVPFHRSLEARSNQSKSGRSREEGDQEHKDPSQGHIPNKRAQARITGKRSDGINDAPPEIEPRSPKREPAIPACDMGRKHACGKNRERLQEIGSSAVDAVDYALERRHRVFPITGGPPIAVLGTDRVRRGDKMQQAKNRAAGEVLEF